MRRWICGLGGVLVGLMAMGMAQAVWAQGGVESNLPGAGFGPDDTNPIAVRQAAAPTIRVYSRETVIDVIATDDKGQPVTGLTRDDFTIEEDGRPQPIRSFREYADAGARPAQRQLPPHTYTNAQALPASGPVQIFLIDAAGAATQNIVRSRPYIADYFRTMPAGTEVAIFLLSPTRGLLLVQGFTTDGALAAESLAKHTDAEWYPPPGQLIDQAAKIAAIDQLAAYVAGIHGRKNLIWVGSPMLILRDGGVSWGVRDMTVAHRLMDLYDRFTQEEIAVCPLDPGGLNFNLVGDEVAEQTGGITSGPTNDYKSVIAKVVDETRHSYTLSYVPTRPDSDGHFHPITIKVKRAGVHLNYRTGYNDEQPGEPDPVLKQRLIQGPMRLGALPTTQVLFDLQVEATPAANMAAFTAAETAMKPGNGSERRALDKSLKGTPYDAVFRFDPTQISFANGADGKRTANLEFDLGAYDLYSNLVVARSQSLKIVLSAAEYDEFMRTPFRFYLPIPLPKGELMLHAGVFDTVANTSGTLQIAVTVAKR